jgi:DNA replication protein DnaC
MTDPLSAHTKVDPDEAMTSFEGMTVIKVNGTLSYTERVKCFECHAEYTRKVYENQPVRWYAQEYSWCPKCAAAKDKAWEREKERRAGLERVKVLVDDGKLDQWQVDCLKSDPEKALPNIHTWAELKAIEHKYQVLANNWFVTGTPGTGKTHAACHLMMKAIMGGASHLFISGRNLEEHLLEYKPPREMKHRLVYSGVLVLDDIETMSFEKHKVMTGFWQLLDDRSKGKTTIITTKLTGNGLFGWLSNKSPDHSPGMGANALERFRPYKILNFVGESLRD